MHLADVYAISNRLEERIVQSIQAKNGWISFAEFMQTALYEPALGYYVAGAHKFGEEGDFITAPVISPAFSECLARECMSFLLKGDAILEFGAGNGVMAADMLLFLEKQHALPASYLILEVSPDLQERQYETLQKKCSHLSDRVRWLSRLPENFEGVVIANEVLDAMPVHLFEIHDDIAYEKGVTFDQGGFAWKKNNEKIIDFTWLSDISLLPNGYSSEYCSAIDYWLRDLYAGIKRGVVIIIDYGFLEKEYYHPDRYQGTLMCHYRHRAHSNPFIHIGLQDITAHVNFSALGRSAESCGFTVENYVTQAEFLLSRGILEPVNLPLKEAYHHAQALKKLLLPSEMGELFKVMTLSKQ